MKCLKQVKIFPYSSIYKDGTLSLLKRNFAWMSRYSDEKLYSWFSPLAEYKWHGSTDPGDLPYRYGLVLLDGGNIVGYCGATYSYQNIGGRKRLYMCMSTFAVDKDYRFYIFPAVKELCASAEVVTDFTPRESMRRLFLERFHFQQMNSRQIIMFPVPSFSRRVSVEFISREEDIYDSQMQKIFADHEPYGIKCCQFERDGEKCCIFYSSAWRMRWKRRIPCWKKITVLKVVNSDLFARNLHEIVWKIQKHEGVYAEFDCDAAFIGSDFSHPLYIERPVYRLVYPNEDSAYKYDFMYSEFSMLKI